jgi:cytochrome bd-type quinol oxidase subunit 2
MGTWAIKLTAKMRFDMHKLFDTLTLLVGVCAAAVAVLQFLTFVTYTDAKGLPDMTAGINHLWLALAAGVVACACAVAFYTRHSKSVEEIHLTR